MDELGRVLRSVSDLPLPIPLGQLARWLIGPLPEHTNSRWETSGETTVLDDLFNMGVAEAFMNSQPYGFYHPGYGPGGRWSSALLIVMRPIE